MPHFFVSSLSDTFPDHNLEINVAKCNLGKVKIEASAGQRCPHGRGTWGRLFHFAGAPGFLQLTCLCQFISHLFTWRSVCCLSLLLPVPPTLW